MNMRRFGGAIVVFGIVVLCLVATYQAKASGERQQAPTDLPLFTDVTESAGVVTPDGKLRLAWGASWGDFNGDGFPDLLAGRHFDIPGLFRNNGDGTFTDIVQSTPLNKTGDPHGAAWGDYDNDGDQDLFVSVGGQAGQGTNPSELYRSDGDGIFVNVAEEAGVSDPMARGRSVSWADYDRDGDLDIYVVNALREGFPNRLWRNNGDGTFTDVAAEAGVADSLTFHGGSFVDYDRDGWPDIFLVFGTGEVILYHNKGDGTFEDVSAATGFAGGAAPNYDWGDYDADGDADLFMGTSPESWFDNVEWEGTVVRFVGKATGDQDGVDLEVAGQQLEFELALRNPDCLDVTCIHIGADGSPPATNPFTVGPEAYGTPDYTPGVSYGYYIWRDSGTDLWHVRMSHALGAGLAFRYIGIVTATVPFTSVVPVELEPPPMPGRAMLWRNEGDGTFTEVSTEAHLDIAEDYLNPNWVDFDNDGWLDLFVVARGNVAIGNGPDHLFRNNGDGTFQDVAALVGVEGTTEGAGQVSAWADYDRNGFLDLFTMHCGHGGPLRTDCGPEQLFRNEGNANHWLQMGLVGQISNREGLGAIVSVSAGGRTQVRAHNDGVTRYCQDGNVLHFGLGDSTVVDSIVIDWPSGIHQVLTNVPVDQQLTIVEPVHDVYLPLILK